MSYRLTSLAVAAVIVCVVPDVGAQSGATDLIKLHGAGPIPTGITFPMPKDLQYRSAWAINTGPATPDSVVPGFQNVARFLHVSDVNGVPRSNVHLAIVVWGSATFSLLKNEAYRAAKGSDNASIALLQALNDAGVQVIVCGEALINRKLAAKDLLSFVKIAPTATHALATLQAQGYGVFRP